MKIKKALFIIYMIIRCALIHTTPNLYAVAAQRECVNHLYILCSHISKDRVDFGSVYFRRGTLILETR